MPELPEVETVVKAINKSIGSKTISELNIINNKLRWPIDNQLSINTKNEDILKIYRRGKHIIFKLIHGYILIHLGMTGIIKYIDKGTKKEIRKT